MSPVKIKSSLPVDGEEGYLVVKGFEVPVPLVDWLVSEALPPKSEVFSLNYVGYSRERRRRKIFVTMLSPLENRSIS